MRTVLVLLFLTGSCFAQDAKVYTEKDRAEMNQLVLKYAPPMKTLRKQMPDILWQSWQAVIDQEIKKRTMEKTK